MTAFTSFGSFFQMSEVEASISCEIFAKLWFADWQTRQNNLIGPRANKKFEFSYQPRQVSEDFGGGWLNCVLDFSDIYMQVRKKQFCHRYAGGTCKVCFGRRNWTKKAKSLGPHKETNKQIFNVEIHSRQGPRFSIGMVMRRYQMFQKVEYGLPAKIWRLVGCTEMVYW